MLTENTISMLSAFTLRADAKRKVCALPLAGIYWDDELPELRELVKIPEDDRDKIFRLLGIRSRLWKGESLSDDDQQFWNEMQLLLSSWAVFQRVEVSAEDLQAEEDANRETVQALQAWFAEADEVSVTEKNGVQQFSLTFDLTKGEQTVLPRERGGSAYSAVCPDPNSVGWRNISISLKWREPGF